MKKKYKISFKLKAATLVMLFSISVGIIGYFNVDRDLTVEDKEYIKQYIPNIPENIASSLSYSEQIKLIKNIQLRVYSHTPGWSPIPEGMPREPKQLFLSQSGLCYDRSRVLEKIFDYLGFTTRHLSMFKRESDKPAIITILTSHVSSHAITEVLTKRGWLMIDSNVLWVSLDSKGLPRSMPQLQKLHVQGRNYKWAAPPIGPDSVFYQNRSIPVYGLFSRHGRFYYPYVSGIPDYHVQSLKYNFE